MMELSSAKKIVRNDSFMIIFKIDLIHLECSAFTGENIETIFNLMTKTIIKRIEEGVLIMNENPGLLPNIIDIKPESIPDKSGCTSC